MPPEVVAFELSGFRPVKSWLDDRMASGAGRTSSPLDEIRPAADVLPDRAIAGEPLPASAFPTPTPQERKGPAGRPPAPDGAPLFD